MELHGDSVERWFSRVCASSADRYSVYFGELLGWLGDRGFESDPDRLVEFQRRNRDFQILDLLQEFDLGKEGRKSTKRFAYASVRSFFMHNRAPLPQDRSFRLRGDRLKVIGSLTVDEVWQIVAGANELYRAVLLCMFQGGMGAEELVFWSDNRYESLLEQLDRHMHPVKVDLPGRKMSRNERPFYTFIGRDAVDALKVWLRKRGLSPEAIFLNQYDGPLKKSALRRYWMQRLHRLGLIEKPENADSSIRYGKNIHKMRDLFRSRFQKSQADLMAAEFFMGHVIDPNEYNKAFQDRDYAEEQYLIAEHWLNIMSEDPKKVPIKDVRRMQRRYEKAYQEIREELEYLKELIGERRE